MAGTNQVVVIVGIPAVGKTSVVKVLVDMIKRKKKKVRVVSFGTEMLKCAKKYKVNDRDKLRKLTRKQQDRLQLETAKRISKIKVDILVVDTHAFISTPVGYYPGLPSPILDIILPTQFVSLSAKPERIYTRRELDRSRKRDRNSISLIKRELAIQDAMLASCSVHSGSPITPIFNRDGKVQETAIQIMETMGL